MNMNGIKNYLQNIHWIYLILVIIIPIALNYVYPLAGVWLIIGSLILGILIKENNDLNYILFYGTILTICLFAAFYYTPTLNLRYGFILFFFCLFISLAFIWIGTALKPYFTNYYKKVSNRNKNVEEREEERLKKKQNK